MDGAARDNSGLEGRINNKGARAQRLRSWKEIAAYFGTDERTVKRWEASRGLPIHRVPGGSRTPVFADVAELEQWIFRRDDVAEATAEPQDEPPVRPRRRILLPGLAALGLGGAAIALMAWPEQPSTTASRRSPSPEATEAYLAGVYHWERRTPESLNQAVQLFGQAIARDPDFAEAHAGLANCYLLLREYSLMPPAEAYPRAAAAAQRALSLDPNLSDAHAARAFVDFYWGWNFLRARRGFERAIALDPSSARAHHWYATALIHMGDAPRALQHIAEAQRLEPQSRAILADRGLILYRGGRVADGLALLGQVERADPDFLSPHAYLAAIHFSEGNYRQALAEAEAAARLKGDRQQLATLAAAAAAFDRGGAEPMLRTILAGQQRERAAGGGSEYGIASTYALLGDRSAALRHLERSVRTRESLAVGLRIEPAFRTYRDDPVFRRLARQMGMPEAG